MEFAIVLSLVLFISTALLLFQFHTGSPAEFRKAKEQCALLSGVSYADEVRTLRRGEALAGAQLSTDGRFSQRAHKIILRPSCIHAGGVCRAILARSARAELAAAPAPASSAARSWTRAALPAA